MLKIFSLLSLWMALSPNLSFAQNPAWPQKTALIQSLGFQNYEFEIHTQQVSVVVFRVRSFAEDTNQLLIRNVAEVARFFEFDPRIRFFYVDVFQEPFLTAQLKIKNYPTTLVYQWGELARSTEGYMNIEDVFEIVDGALNGS